MFFNKTGICRITENIFFKEIILSRYSLKQRLQNFTIGALSQQLFFIQKKKSYIFFKYIKYSNKTLVLKEPKP